MLKLTKNIIIIGVLISIIFNINAFANGYTKILDSSSYATVVDIIDGDAIKVKLNNGETAYVKLAGINANGYDSSYTYLMQKILGATVLLVNENSATSNKWNYMLVYYNGTNINQDLIEKGYAIIDNTQNKTSINNSLVSAQSNATAYGNGVWAYNSKTASTLTGQTSTALYTGNKVNINTATESQLKNYLNNITDKLASEIVAYRSKNPFSNITELKFVDGMTRDIYNQNKNIITVSTNINTAQDIELKTLRELSDSEIDKIIAYRSEKEFTKIETLKDFISYTKYSNIEPYISVTGVTEIYNTINTYIANINGSDKTYLTYTGLSNTNAGIVTSYRTNGYTYKTLEELLKLPGFSTTKKELHYLEDNLNIMTNLNAKNKNELSAIFSENLTKVIYSTDISSSATSETLKKLLTNSVYDKVKDYIYIGSYSTNYINLNTATQTELTNIGFSVSQANQIINSRPITNSSMLPFNISQLNTKISLYTNINTASSEELKSLSSKMSSSIISNIKSYVKEQPFNSLDELKEYLTSIGESQLYTEIKDYIVFR